MQKKRKKANKQTKNNNENHHHHHHHQQQQQKQRKTGKNERPFIHFPQGVCVSVSVSVRYVASAKPGIRATIASSADAYCRLLRGCDEVFKTLR